MPSLKINNIANTLELRLTVADALLAAKLSTLMEFPLENIRLPVIAKPEQALRTWQGWGYGGFPGVGSAGTFWSSDSSRTKSFIHFRNPNRTILIPLRHDNYHRLIIEVDEDTTPEEFAEQLRHAVEDYNWERQRERRNDSGMAISA